MGGRDGRAGSGGPFPAATRHIAEAVCINTPLFAEIPYDYATNLYVSFHLTIAPSPHLYQNNTIVLLDPPTLFALASFSTREHWQMEKTHDVGHSERSKRGDRTMIIYLTRIAFDLVLFFLAATVI